ncbi:unnamed protein product, partial [marine sediment metagenome]
VVVSTDDGEIAQVAMRFSAEVIIRPAEISGDSAPSELALLHVLEHLEAVEGYEPEWFVFLQCTSPLTIPEDIDATVKVLLESQADTALAVTPFHYFLWAYRAGEGVSINHNKDVRPLRQERESQYRETGAVYAMRTEGFRRSRHRFFGKTELYVMPNERCLEIDDPVDFRIAEVLLRDRQQAEQAGSLPKKVEAVVLDFDGVFTDNKVLTSEYGGEAVICNRSDGWGLARLKEAGVPILVLSTEHNSIVAARCNKLGLECRQAVSDKLHVLDAWLDEKCISRDAV